MCGLTLASDAQSAKNSSRQQQRSKRPSYQLVQVPAHAHRNNDGQIGTRVYCQRGVRGCSRMTRMPLRKVHVPLDDFLLPRCTHRGRSTQCLHRQSPNDCATRSSAYIRVMCGRSTGSACLQSFEHRPNSLFWINAKGSISIQEGEPNLTFCQISKPPPRRYLEDGLPIGAAEVSASPLKVRAAMISRRLPMTGGRRHMSYSLVRWSSAFRVPSALEDNQGPDLSSGVALNLRRTSAVSFRNLRGIRRRRSPISLTRTDREMLKRILRPWPITSTRTTRGAVRVHAGSDRTEPGAARQTCSSLPRLRRPSSALRERCVR
jgi:hypothetical protein